MSKMMEQQHQPERLLTRQEVAKRYSINPRTVDRWEAEDKIPKRIPKWVGCDPRWREADIDRHILGMCKAEQQEQVA